ncbi:MAG: hypothetical protein VXZ06_01030, partial [Actinomycetota bacterium]|nr:hypothetical protein [Actinomycetota bacterium]
MVSADIASHPFDGYSDTVFLMPSFDVVSEVDAQEVFVEVDAQNILICEQHKKGLCFRGANCRFSHVTGASSAKQV